MFEIAWSELFLVIIVAIIVVGPKELPGMLRAFGRTMGKLRRSADDFRRQFEDSMREAGGEDLQRELNALRQNNPLNDIRNTIEDAAREADKPTRLPTPDTQLAPPEEPPASPTDYIPSTKPEDTALAASAPLPSAPPAPALTETAPSAKEQNGSAAGHEPLANGQHRHPS